MPKYVRVMDGNISNQSGRKFKIDEVTISDEWDPNATQIDTIKGINFSTEESIIRWIRRGDTIYDVELPNDAQVIKVPGTFTPDGIYRTNKIIVKNPRKLTENVVMDLYKKSNIPDKTYHDVLAILAIRKFENVCMQLIRDRVTKENIDDFLNDYTYFGKNDIKDNNYGLYEKYKEILVEIKSDLDISLTIFKKPYIKQLTNDNIINLTGQSGSGKSTYANEHFNTDEYLIIDTDEIFSDKRFQYAKGISKELGEMFRSKYHELPDLGSNFDLIYRDILNYCKKYDKTIIIDCAQFHCIKDINILKGKIIIIRTDIDTCYKRCIDRYKTLNPNYSKEDLNKYSNKKLNIYKWYKGTNDFIKRIDSLEVK